MREARLSSSELVSMADRILRSDRNNGGSKPGDFNLLSKRDLCRRQLRQIKIADKNREVLQSQVSPQYRMNPESIIVRKEEKYEARQMLLRANKHFKNDEVVRRIVVVAIQHEAKFHCNAGISKASGIILRLIRAAKERLKYFVRNSRANQEIALRLARTPSRIISY